MDEFPSIKECISSIKDIGYNPSIIQSPNLVADLLTSIIGFMGYLDKDRQYMQRRISDTFPPNDEIPALSAIFEDSALFAVFISMLSTKPKNIDDFSAIPLRKGHTGGFSQKNIPAFNSDTKDQITSDVSKSRKRSLSNSSATSIEQSPKKILCTNASRELEVSRSSFSNEHRIIPVDFNFSVLAAIIFQISFSYLEYWPAIFAQLYAEDCFGSRRWVDDKRCEGFVSIISSVLKDEGEHHIDELDKADAFHTGFESYLKGANSLLSNSKSYERLIQAASNDNQHDSDSDEEKSTLKIIAGSVDKAEYHDIRMKHDNESSSSGDEEIEEEELIASLAVPLTSTTMVEGEKTTSGGDMHKHSNYTELWWKPNTVENFDHSIRYIGSIRERAHQMIGIALEARLSEKTKQNSSLLTSLQSFLVVPHVRSLVAAQLEKWLQSPAVSGLGRTLFSSLVASIKKVDPLLPEDARALNSILNMPLKQNQFQMHMDNLINLIQRIPSLAVTEEIILYTLNDKMETVDDVDSSKDIGDDRSFDLLKAIFKIVSVRVAHIALAKSILSILNRWYHEQYSTEEDQVIRLCILLNRVVVQLNDKYDGQVLISEMLSEKNLEGLFITRRSISHVVLYAILWMTPRDLLESCNENGQPIPSDSFMQQILESKKIILNWYLRSYTLGGEVNSILHRSKQPIPPNFDSILTGEMKSPTYQDEMEVLLCLMFVMESDSTAMQRFTSYKDQTRGLKAEEYSKRMSLCIANGRVVDDELLNILLKFANDKKRQIAGSDILSVIEHMLYACSIDHGVTLHIKDEYIVWKLFGLCEKHYQTQSAVEGIKIACPGLWWRVMVIALVICGKSTNIADVMWDACPTLHVLMKMIITNRFTFPTVDCDESQRIKMEEFEYKARKDEYKIAETLFLPQEHKVSKVAKSSNAIINPPKGTRYSARQKEKRMRVLDIELQKQKDLEAAEEQRINHLLKEARKSVILLNPRGVARKPPQASMKLLLYSCDVFQLSAGLINCSKPDFVLKTIGNTSRNGIERAYAWLIPIISVYPSVIDRLPSSASCFLLLRAYGKRSENAEKLLKLSSPLLDHVKRSIRGDLDDDAVKRAADLLFYDLKSQDSERRSCARRLLSEALLDSKEAMRKEQNGFSTEFQWLVALTELKHRKLVLDYAVPCLSDALLLESDEILKAYIFALKYYDELGLYPSNMDSVDFQLMNLMHMKSINMCIAIERFVDLRNLCLHVIHNHICRYPIQVSHYLKNESTVTIHFYTIQPTTSTFLPLSSFRAAIALLSNWRYWEKCDTNDKMEALTSFLLPYTEKVDVNCGAAGAKFTGTDKLVMRMNDWIGLVKSPCETIAMLAVQAAPDYSLVRFLSCCGISSKVVTAILQRLDGIVNEYGSSYECFPKFTSQKAIDKWSVGHSMKRNEVIKNLHGRVKAHLANTDAKPNSFCNWLYEEASLHNSPIQTEIQGNKSYEKHRVKEEWIVFDENEETPGEATSILNIPVNGLNGQLHTADDMILLTHSDEKISLSELIRSTNVSRLDSKLVVILLKELAVQTTKKDLLFSVILQLLPVLYVNESNIDLLDAFILGHSNPSIQLMFDTILHHFIRNLPDNIVREYQALIIKYLVDNKIPPEFYGAVLSFFLLRRLHPLSCSYGRILYMNTYTTGVTPLTHLALSHGSRTWPEDSVYFPRSTEHCSDWVLLLLMLGSYDKECLLIVSKLVIDYKSPSICWNKNVLPGLLLHLYAMNPEKMDLEISVINDHLIGAMAELHQFWRNFSTPIDDQIRFAIKLMDMQTLQVQQQIVMDFVKRSPVVAIKNIPDLIDVLNRDATARPKQESENGRQFVRYPSLYAFIPELSGTPSNVSILHWGTSFSEPLWIAILDILLAFPNEILFKCGHFFRLGDILYVYIQLFKVQFDVQQEMDRLLQLRIRNKFLTILDRYKSINEKRLIEWIESTRDGYKIGTLLEDVGCNPYRLL